MDDPRWNGDQGRGGITWEERAHMGPLRGVLDPADTRGHKNRYMDYLHRRVLAHALAGTNRRFERALDFGCGTGRFVPLLASYCRELHAVDRSPAMVQAASAYAGECAASIGCCNGTLPFSDDSFDLILSFCVLSVTASWLFEPSLRELRRVSAPGALLMLYEQVARDRAFTVERYRSALEHVGFTLKTVLPIRSASSRLTRIAQSRWTPPIIYPLLAAAERQVTQRQRFDFSRETYVEYLFLFERSA